MSDQLAPLLLGVLAMLVVVAAGLQVSITIKDVQRGQGELSSVLQPTAGA